MFFLIQREDKLELPPRYFGRSLQNEIIHALRGKVEGKCSGRYGYTLAVTNLESISKGKLDDDSGYAEFHVTYLSLVFRPLKQEIIPSIVQSVTSNGLFVTAGPLTCFISDKLMPEDLHFDTSSTSPMYVSDSDNVRIEVGTHIRVKIVGMRHTADDIVCIGTIKEDFLG